MSAALLLAAAATAFAGPLAQKGERVEGAEVVDTVDHPEFHRLDVRLEDGRLLSIELAATPSPMGACTHHGLSLQPRWELLDVHDAQLEDQPPVVTELCRRLEVGGPPVSLRPPQTGQGSPDSASEGPDGASSGEHASPGTSSSTVTRVVRAPVPKLEWMSMVVGVLALLSVGLGATRGRAAWRRLDSTKKVELAGLTALGLGTRMVLGLWSVVWAPSFGFGRLGTAMGASGSVPLYGDGFAAMLGAPIALFGTDADLFFTAQLLLGSLAVPLVWGLTRTLVQGSAAARTAPLLAGLWMALMPAHVWLSTSEVMHISLVTVELLAVLLAVLFVGESERRLGVGLALAGGSALATGLAVHTRPEALPFLLVPLGWIVLKLRPSHRLGLVLSVMLTAGLAAPRLLTILLDVNPAESAVDYSRLTELNAWRSFFTPTLADPKGLPFVNTALHPSFASPLFVPLALLGLVRAPRKVALWLAAWWGLATLPILLKAWPLADALRLQLPGLVPVVVLAGMGASVVVDRLAARWSLGVDSPRLRGGVAVGMVVLLLPHTVLERPSWGPIAEARHFIDALEQVPETATVFYDDGDIHAEGRIAWAASQRPGSQWRPMSMGTSGESLSSPLMAWVGTSCDARPRQDDPAAETAEPSSSPGCAWLREACGLRPADVVEVSGETDSYLQDFEGPVMVGLYYVDDCAPTASED